MLARIASVLVSLVVAALLVTLAVANRHAVDLKLDPFNPEAPVLAISLPFFGYLFAMLILGVILGGVATWMSQGKWRRAARNRTQEALRWKAEAERLVRERDQRVAQGQAAPGERRQLAAIASR